jgi:hypothetical protein
MKDVSRFVRAYEAGDMLLTELSLAFILAAAEQSPEEIVGLLGPEHLAAVRERAVNPPSAPEKMRIVRIGSGMTADSERKEQLAYYCGAWAWHAYFQRIEGGAFA